MTDTDTDRTAFVLTGTAGSGEAVVRTVAEAGGTVGFTYNDSSEQAEELLADLPGEGHEAWQCDVTEAGATADVVDEAFETLGAIDALVYTVGVISSATVGEVDPEAWANHLDANVTGAVNVLRAATPHLEEQGDGAVVALSASDGIIRNDGLSAYDASKKGLEALVQEAARELGPHGVRANVVAPGFIRDPDAISGEQREELLEQLPYKRVTRPQDVADVALYLCSDDAATVTGAVVPADSGLAL
ncbi:MAG: SDR family NAD(P)-dependent oxidoreductase [Salinirussus sp.]